MAPKGEYRKMKITKVEPQHLGTDIELLPDAAKIRPPLTKPIAMRPHFDGFIVDQ